MKTLDFTVKHIVPFMKQTRGGRWYKVWFTVEVDHLNDFPQFSMDGVEGPLKSGNCLGSAGQIKFSIECEDRDLWKLCKGYTMDTIDNLLSIWDQWHLKNITKGMPDGIVDFLNGLQDRSSEYPWR